MTMNCPTVIIKTDNGPVVMNESEYDPKIHTLHVDDAKAQKPGKAAAKRKAK